MEKKALFIDGVNQVHFLNGVIRLNTFTLTPRQEGEPIQEASCQLVMTPQGFLSIFGAMQQLADKLTESGLLQKK